MRCTGAAIAAALAYVLTLFSFLTYEQRQDLGLGSYVVFALMMLIAGFFFARDAGRNHLRIAGCALLGVFVAHSAVVAADLTEDPTHHNLLPFEFIFLAMFAAPAFLGAILARSMDSDNGSSGDGASRAD
jgi:hypothetical protein